MFQKQDEDDEGLSEGSLFAFSLSIGLGISSMQAQETASKPSVLHIVQTQTTAPPPTGEVPTFLATYHVLDGAKSPANLLALKGTLSIKNDSQNFSQVLWVLVYWQVGEEGRRCSGVGWL